MMLTLKSAFSQYIHTDSFAENLDFNLIFPLEPLFQLWWGREGAGGGDVQAWMKNYRNYS